MSAPDKARQLKPPHLGYGTQAYAVDLKRLRSAIGSNDPGLLNAIEEKYAREIRRSDAWFSDVDHRLDRRGAPSVGTALAQIIGGQITGPDWAESRYGYATELLCKHLGHWLGHGESMSYIDDLDLATHFAESGLPLPIPRQSLGRRFATSRLSRFARSTPARGIKGSPPAMRTMLRTLTRICKQRGRSSGLTCIRLTRKVSA
jgi:hypothetical protein